MEENSTEHKADGGYRREPVNEDTSSFQVEYTHTDREGMLRRLSEYSGRLSKREGRPDGKDTECTINR